MQNIHAEVMVLIDSKNKTKVSYLIFYFKGLITIINTVDWPVYTPKISCISEITYNSIQTLAQIWLFLKNIYIYMYIYQLKISIAGFTHILEL